MPQRSRGPIRVKFEQESIPESGLPGLLSTRIRDVAQRSKNEEELKIGIEYLLKETLQTLGIPTQVQYERSVYRSRRADALYPGVVIEYKRPGSLRSRTTRETAIDELRDGLKGMSRQEVIARRFIGIAIDGLNIVFVRGRAPGKAARSAKVQSTLEGGTLPDETELEVLGPVEINPATVERFLLYLRQLGRRTLSPEGLVEIFGPAGGLAGKAVGVVLEQLHGSKNRRVATLFEEWDRIFGIVYGKDLARAQRDMGEIARLYRLPADAGLKNALFCVQTYFALLMKMLAAEILSLRSGGLVSSFVHRWSVCTDEELRSEMEELESGGLFRTLGIRNFLEGDFFSWYLEEWSPRLAASIREIATALGEFEPATTELEPDQAKDLLKRLYQFLVPRAIRHDLGEYYTPDWLAEQLMDASGYEGSLGTRFLDPACGSGTFLVLAIKRVVSTLEGSIEADASGAAEKVLANIVGFDINPLAVLAARTNYLIALTPLRKEALADIELPVYLADSVLTPESYPTLLEKRYFHFRTTVGDFRIHQSLVKKGVIDKVLTNLEESISHHGSASTFRESLRDTVADEEAVSQNLADLFGRMKKLESEGRDKIWTRILKNNAAPIYVGRFDYVVGNPPWIHWEDLSEEYRAATTDLWERLGLLSRKEGRAYVAQSAVDFSVLFTYASVKHYLTPTGTLAFLISQTVFKSELGGRGFRQFRLPGRDKLMRIEEVDDLSSFLPFEGAANKTSFFALKNGAETQYPVRYIDWQLRPGFTVSQAGAKPANGFLKTELEARPSTADPLSAWSTATRKDADLFSKIYGQAAYGAKVGADTLGANGVYWVDPLASSPDGFVRLRNRPESGDNKSLPVREASVESDLVFPLVRGRDITGRWRANPSCAILVPHDRRTGWRAIDPAVMQTRYPRALSYFQAFRDVLANRPSYKDRRAKHPYYIIFRVYPESFYPYKVAWQRMTKEMKAVVLSPARLGPLENREVIPTDTVTFVSAKKKEEAHFICAILNSTSVRAAISAYSLQGRGFGAPHILEHVRIPRFDSGSALHASLASSSLMAHEAASNNDEGSLARVESEIDQKTKKLFGISS